MSEDFNNTSDQTSAPDFENLSKAQVVVNNLFRSEYGVYFTENNISSSNIIELALRKLQTEDSFTEESEKLSIDRDDNILNFVYLSYEYLLDEYFQKYRAQIILNIQTREDYDLVFQGVKNLQYLQVDSNDESISASAKYSIVQQEIGKVLEQIRTYGVTSTFFLAYLKDRFSSYRDLERMLSSYLNTDLAALLESQFIK